MEQINMTYEQFRNMVTDEILRYLPDEYADADVSIQTVIKNNDTKLYGLNIKTDSTNISTNIYLDQFFEAYKDGKSETEVLSDIADFYLKSAPSESFDVSRITDYEQVKDKILCKLINRDDNREFLADKPYTAVEDLAVVYIVKLGSSIMGEMSVTITDKIMESYGLNVQELHQLAIDNLAKTKLKFQTMREVLVEMMGDSAMLDFLPEEENPGMYVLTNESKVNGAIAILDHKMMEQIAEKLGGDFVVLPSSIHECIVLPMRNGYDPNELESMVREVNTNQVAPEERLSDHVYMYDSVQKELILAEKMAERLREREDQAPSAAPADEEVAQQRRHRGR